MEHIARPPPEKVDAIPRSLIPRDSCFSVHSSYNFFGRMPAGQSNGETASPRHSIVNDAQDFIERSTTKERDEIREGYASC